MADVATIVKETQAKPTQVYQAFIKATPEAVWDAITKPEFTQRYFYGSSVDSDFRPGSAFRSYIDGDLAVDGEVLESDPPRRLVHMWRALYDPELAAEAHS